MKTVAEIEFAIHNTRKDRVRAAVQSRDLNFPRDSGSIKGMCERDSHMPPSAARVASKFHFATGWVTSLVQYLSSVPKGQRTLDRGNYYSPYQTSNTTTQQKYVNIVPWLATSGFDAKSFAQALTTLSKPGLNDIIGVLGPRENKKAPIVRSNYRIGVAGDDLTLTYSETIYYN